MKNIPLFALAMIFAASAWAHGKDGHSAKAPRAISSEEMRFGREGDPTRVTRTVRVGMSDAMRFSPAKLTVRRGETVRFIVRNRGRLMHEMVIGTIDELKEHAELMRRFPEMEHDDPWMAHVAPGKTGTIVWQFTSAGEFRFGCLQPGHFEAGMVGRIVVKP